MTLARLKLALLVLVFAWSQVCCCQVWTFMNSARHAMDQAPAAVSLSCCGEHGATNTSRDEPADGIPCKEHKNCAGCLPRVGWVPEGPAQPTEDLIGAALPPADFAEPLTLAQDAPSGHGHARDSERSQRCLAPTLVRLRCALVI